MARTDPGGCIPVEEIYTIICVYPLKGLSHNYYRGQHTWHKSLISLISLYHSTTLRSCISMFIMPRYELLDNSERVDERAMNSS